MRKFICRYKKIKFISITVFLSINLLLFNLNAQNIENMENKLEQLGFKRISPMEIQGNTFNMFANDWALVTAGNLQSYNTMTIGWGDFGVLWGRPIVTVYVSSSRYTKQFMDENVYFTVEFFDESYRNALSYLGSHSGRDEDKVKNAGLTPIATDNGNATFKESRIIVEAKKIYSHEFDSHGLTDEVKQWYAKRRIGLHTMYIGEIINIWIKE